MARSSRHDDANGAGYVPVDDFERSFEQLPYAATRMRFFEDLRRYTTSLIPFRATSGPWRSSINLHALVITESTEASIRVGSGSS